jgi:dTMP kinase
MPPRPMMNHLRGKFLVFDGNEGSGKSTQTHLLRDALLHEGLDVLTVRDPGSTRIGEQIRAILLNPEHTEMNMRCEMLCYMASRAQMMAETIRPALDAGRTVVCDRFVSSTLAYQLGGDGLTADDIRAVAQVAIGGRWPDLTILLDMPVEASSDRVLPKFLMKLSQDSERKLAMKDRIEQRPLSYHAQVRQNYLAQAKADPHRYRVIKADRDPQAVHQDVMAAVQCLGR